MMLIIVSLLLWLFFAGQNLELPLELSFYFWLVPFAIMAMVCIILTCLMVCGCTSNNSLLCGDSIASLYVFAFIGVIVFFVYAWVGGLATAIVISENQFNGTNSSILQHMTTSGTVTAGATANVPATYCSANANTPLCCETVWWAICASMCTPLLYIPLLIGSCNDSKAKESFSKNLLETVAAIFCAVAPQLAAAGIGASVLTR